MSEIRTDLTHRVQRVLMEDVGDDLDDPAVAKAEVAAVEVDGRPEKPQTIIHCRNSFCTLIQ